MLVCPLDYRYGREEMKSVFSKENKTDKLLKVEAALARAHSKLGNVPEEAAETITKNATTEIVDWEEVERVEKEETKHDIMALVKVLGKHCGDAEKYIHLGATSNDIIDTGMALQLKETVDILEEDIQELKSTLSKRAREHKDTVMIGRTHGQHAIPMTFGLKMAVYTAEIQRHLERLREAKKRILVGKMSGAVGSGAAFGKDAKDIQELVMDDLGLNVDRATGQIVGRDRYAELVSLAANISTSLQKFSTEVRNLQRPEIMETAESFETEKQVGSSTMAHKKNPILAENICGLAKTLRGFVTPTYQNNILWHERDLTNSSSERITVAHVLVLLDDILKKSEKLFRNLEVFPENMRKNIEMSNGLVMAESVMIHLTEKGMSRQEAHEIIREASMKARAEEKPLLKILLKKEDVMEITSIEELETVFDPEEYLGSSP
ncbi:MAG: adenylosuccinate lyase, partial [Candidatus Thermoplasmatota archaeon]|nr:adenylosuccinate lyase [Candidatus Thermoplasmatota archaeon]